MAAVATYNCPYCAERKGSPDTKGHLYYYGPDKGYHCFRCGAHHSSAALPADLTENTGKFDLPAMMDEQERDNGIASAEPAWRYQRAREYLMHRGLTEEEVTKHQVLYATKGWLQGRVVFPILDAHGKMAFFVARAIDSWRTPKYINAPWGKNGLVYPVGVFPTSTVVVVEGIFDAFAVWRAGFSAAALLGRRINAGQCNLLAALAGRAIVLLDADAFASALEVSYSLSLYLPTVRVEVEPGAADPASTERIALRASLGAKVKEWESAGTIPVPSFKRTRKK